MYVFQYCEWRLAAEARKRSLASLSRRHQKNCQATEAIPSRPELCDKSAYSTFAKRSFQPRATDDLLKNMRFAKVGLLRNGDLLFIPCICSSYTRYSSRDFTDGNISLGDELLYVEKGLHHSFLTCVAKRTVNPCVVLLLNALLSFINDQSAFTFGSNAYTPDSK